MNLQRSYFLTHSPIDFLFTQNARDFVVEELPLYPFSGDGEHRVLKIRKKGLSTWEMLDILSARTGIKKRDFGYAGLKDKEALTYQYISFNKKYDAFFENFEHDQIKVVERTLHKNKIKKGHLKGNRFFIRLKKVFPMDAEKIRQAMKRIEEEGLPNYFGYQRFGKDGDNHIQGEQLIQGKLRIKNPTMRTFLVNAYQSHLFNAWLSKRVEISHLIGGFGAGEAAQGLPELDAGLIAGLQKQPQFLKILPGDVISHYPYGRLFYAEDLNEESRRVQERSTVITGILSGKKCKKAVETARIYEEPYDIITTLDGDRRFAWVYPEEVEQEYRENDAWFELRFTLPKGSYATNVIQEIAKRDIR